MAYLFIKYIDDILLKSDGEIDNVLDPKCSLKKGDCVAVTDTALRPQCADGFPVHLVAEIPDKTADELGQYCTADNYYDSELQEFVIVKQRKYKIDIENKFDSDEIDNIINSENWIFPILTINDIEEKI